jgi:cytochrome c peroxidase
MKEEGFLMSNKRILFAFLTAILAIGLAITLVSAQSTLTPEEQLGKAIFFDQNLSLNTNQACASCHATEVGWTGPISDINAMGSVYEGSIPARFGNRKPPSSGYATFSPIFHLDKKGSFVGGNFWDGRATGEKLGNPAADQAQGPFLNPKEQALPDSACVVYQVCSASYLVSFDDVWGAGSCDIVWPTDIDTVCATEGTTVSLTVEDRAKSDLNYDRIALSIAAYEGSLEVNAFTSKYDYSLVGKSKLTKQERLGFALFMGKGKCNRCHVATGKEALFTDYTYDNLGIPKNPENPATIADPSYADPGLGGYLTQRADYAPYADANLGKFKVPTLRNVGLGLPDIVKAYGHNGFFKSLEGIVHFYNTRDVLDTCPDGYNEAQALANNCWPQPEISENLNTSELGDLGLTPDEEAAIVAFLKTLSDGYVP